MSELEQMFMVGFATFLASSGGFWIYLKKRSEDKDAGAKLLLGLAHYKIVDLGMDYINKGFVTKDEYDDLVRYFYDPYVALGGNGSVERIMRLVQRLPLTLDKSIIAQIADETRLRHEDELKLRKRISETDIVIPDQDFLKRKALEEEARKLDERGRDDPED